MSIGSVRAHNADGWHLGDTNSWCKVTNFETVLPNFVIIVAQAVLFAKCYDRVSL